MRNFNNNIWEPGDSFESQHFEPEPGERGDAGTPAGAGRYPKSVGNGGVVALDGDPQLVPAFPWQQLHPMDGKGKGQVLRVSSNDPKGEK